MKSSGSKKPCIALPQIDFRLHFEGDVCIQSYTRLLLVVIFTLEEEESPLLLVLCNHMVFIILVLK